MLAQRRARRESIEGSSELLFQTHTQLYSCSASTSALSLVDSFSLLWSMPLVQCPVLGCGSWSSSWGKKSYPLPSANMFSLQLDSTIDVSINNRICQPCWERHKNHTMKLDGRTRVHPISSPSPLDALLSAAISPPPQTSVPLSPPPPSTSLPSDTLTQARVQRRRSRRRGRSNVTGTAPGSSCCTRRARGRGREVRRRAKGTTLQLRLW